MQLGGRADIYVVLFGAVYLARCDFDKGATSNFVQISEKARVND
jgi:hypothetical protein